ncbi:MAG: hypothetical protein P1U32_01420 [Legionellaceae bacterium]|nr:hypothetical protein [Legionellaceae bacterium]
MAMNLSSHKLIAQLTKALPQASLLVGSEHTSMLDLAKELTQSMLCESEKKPCGTCRACMLVHQQTHPDMIYITQEKAGVAIKVDQIRQLQQTVYQTPQCALYQIIIIHPANELNRSASNALLKLLEEPPNHTHFILLATHLDTLPQTIMSRCQVHTIEDPHVTVSHDAPGYLNIGLQYNADSPRGLLFKEQATIIQKISGLSHQSTSICQLASEWGTPHALVDWLWFFQLLTTTLLRYQLIPDPSVSPGHPIAKLASKHSPVHYFKQLDMILKFTQQMHQDIPLNSTLVLETLLMGYI